MQKEIELLVLAVQQEQARETQLLNSILSTISTRGVARQQMTQGIASALADSEKSETEDASKRAIMANEIENVIHMMRNKIA